MTHKLERLLPMKTFVEKYSHFTVPAIRAMINEGKLEGVYSRIGSKIFIDEDLFYAKFKVGNDSNQQQEEK